MSERTVAEIREDIIVYLDDAHTKKEIVETIDASPDIIDLIMLGLARDWRIAIAPSTNAQKWQTKSQVKRALARLDAEVE